MDTKPEAWFCVEFDKENSEILLLSLGASRENALVRGYIEKTNKENPINVFLLRDNPFIIRSWLINQGISVDDATAATTSILYKIKKSSETN